MSGPLSSNLFFSSTGTSLVSVDNSALYVSGNSETLTKTYASAGNRRTWTFSTWVYRGKLGTTQGILSADVGAGNWAEIRIHSTDYLWVYFQNAGDGNFQTSPLLRDIGWYHIVVALDTTKAVASNRCIIYINGERVTTFVATTNPSLNLEQAINDDVAHNIGWTGASSEYLDGYLAETVFIDGLQLTPTSFGAYDSSGLYWTPLASATIQELTFGTNGFYLANKVTDAPQLDFQGGDDNTVVLSQYYTLLHFDGSDTSTTFTDSSSFASNWTANGNAQLDTAQKKFGTASLLLDGTGDYASHSSLATVGTQNFTIDFWVRRNGANTDNALLTWGDSGADTGLRILTSTDNKLIVSTGNAGIIGTSDHSTSLPDETWAHVEMVRSGSTLYLFQDGTLLSSKSFSYNLSSTSAWWIGDDVVSAAPSNFNGHIDEVRIVIGYAANTSGFTPPTSAYSNPPTANNWTNNNTVTTNPHTPTNVYGLLNTLSLTATYPGTISGGNLTFSGNASGYWSSGIYATLPCEGKFYWEAIATSLYGTNAYLALGVAPMDLARIGGGSGVSPGGTAGVAGGSLFFNGGSTTNLWSNGLSQNDNIYSALTISTNDVMQVAFDASNGKLWYGKNDTWYNSGDPANGTNPSSTLTATDKYWMPWFGSYTANSTWVVNFGASSFAETKPSGFDILNTTNLASAITRTASDTNKYFDTILYEGNGDSQRVGQFQPFTDTFTVAYGALVPATGGLSRTFDEAGNRQIFSLSTWFKIGQTGEQEASVGVTLFGTKNGSSNSESTWFVVKLNTSNQLVVSIWNDLITTRTFEDTSQWYHLLVAVDTTQGTTADRIKVYINGVQETSFGTANYPSSSASLAWGLDSTAHYVGIHNDGSNYEWNGYLAQTAYITGSQLTPSSFGQTDTSTNRWIPKDISGLTFGSAGFFLDYADSGNVGDDESGNTNDFTNINSVARVTDSPTTNITVLSPNRNLTGGTPSNGNRTILTGSSQYGPIWTEMGLSSGKWYWEAVVTAKSATNTYAMIGVTFGDATSTTQELGYRPLDFGYYSYDGRARNNNAWVTTGWATWVLNDVMGVALDMDAKTVSFYKNNSLQGSVVLPSDGPYYPAFCDWDGSSTVTWTTRFASADWSYSAPTDHIAITQDNMTSSNQFISAFSWIKNRDATDNHMLFDRVRGPFKDIHSNDMVDEVTNANTLQSFLAGGVQIGNNVEVNTASESYVLWNWMMEATGTGSSNTDGTINTTSTLVDQTLGMSISTYVGTGSNATIGHGLGVKPGLILLKVLNSGGSAEWIVYHSALTTGSALFLNNDTAQAASAGYFNNTQPTSSVFTVGTSTYNNASGKNHVAYCFRDSQFISIGSYTNNNNANGTYVPTVNSLGVPIQPAWVLTKTLASANWMINDVKRIGYNVDNNSLYPNATTVESTADVMDIVTGGFKLRTSNDPNYSTSTTIYMAIGTPIIDVDGRIIAGR